MDEDILVSNTHITLYIYIYVYVNLLANDTLYFKVNKRSEKDFLLDSSECTRAAKSGKSSRLRD